MGLNQRACHYKYINILFRFGGSIPAIGSSQSLTESPSAPYSVPHLVQLLQVDAAVVVQVKLLEGGPHDILLVGDRVGAIPAGRPSTEQLQ